LTIKRKREQQQQLETGLAICITNAQALSIQVSLFICGGGPVNFPHTLMFQEHIQNYVKLSMYFYISISAAGMDILEPTVQTVSVGKQVGRNGHHQEVPVGTVNQQVSDYTVLTPQVGNHIHWLEM
jgi:hypothetical protein